MLVPDLIVPAATAAAAMWASAAASAPGGAVAITTAGDGHRRRRVDGGGRVGGRVGGGGDAADGLIGVVVGAHLVSEGGGLGHAGARAPALLLDARDALAPLGDAQLARAAEQHHCEERQGASGDSGHFSGQFNGRPVAGSGGGVFGAHGRRRRRAPQRSLRSWQATHAERDRFRSPLE